MPHDAEVSRVKETFEDWSMYEAVVRHDYMCHQELARGLHTIGAAPGEALRIVDLGCGDAWLATHAFSGLPVQSYHAVDLSDSAVDRARDNVKAWGQAATVEQGNMAEFVAGLAAGSANLVLASNSLHHFDTAGKAAIVGHCFRTLVPQGTLCWIDPVLREGESREAYLTRLTTIMMNDWTGLSEDQRRRSTQHVWDSDFPETEARLMRICEAAGFRFASRFLENELFGAWAFMKP